ncbi:Protein T09B9.5 [Aphelenchoides avenae]|nr:Protein T09B9.5 [Aphelenchus avenae]
MNVVKSTVVLFGTYYPCVTRVTTALCKMQDFPLVFCYILCAVLSLLFGAQTLRRARYSNFSVQQSFIVVVCLIIAMVFTALDESAILRLAKVSITGG